MLVDVEVIQGVLPARRFGPGPDRRYVTHEPHTKAPAFPLVCDLNLLIVQVLRSHSGVGYKLRELFRLHHLFGTSISIS